MGLSKNEAIAIEGRQDANLNILSHLTILARSCPGLRFGQLLAMVNIVVGDKGVSTDDATMGALVGHMPAGTTKTFWKNEFYLESVELEKRVLEAIRKLPK